MPWINRLDESIPGPIRCPACGDESLVPILYGLPDDKLFEAAERGEVVIGGCIVGPDKPAAECTGCGKSF